MKTVKRVYKKKVHKKEHNADLHALALAMIAIIACMVSLCGASWAWFTASTATGTAAIHSAVFNIDDVKITQQSDSNTQVQRITDENGKYTATLVAGNYTLNFKAAESNTANGYCVITVADNDNNPKTAYETENLGKENFSIKIETSITITVEIEPRWGNSTTQDNKLAKDGKININSVNESKPATQSSTPKAQAVTPPAVQTEQAISAADKAKPETDKTEQAEPEADKATSSADESN